MNMQDELEKIDFFKRTNFKGFARGLSKPGAKAGTDVSGLESRQLTAGTLPPPPDLGTPYCSMKGEGGSGFCMGLKAGYKHNRISVC